MWGRGIQLKDTLLIYIYIYMRIIQQKELEQHGLKGKGGLWVGGGSTVGFSFGWLAAPFCDRLWSFFNCYLTPCSRTCTAVVLLSSGGGGGGGGGLVPIVSVSTCVDAVPKNVAFVVK